MGIITGARGNSWSYISPAVSRVPAGRKISTRRVTKQQRSGRLRGLNYVRRYTLSADSAEYAYPTRDAGDLRRNNVSRREAHVRNPWRINVGRAIILPVSRRIVSKFLRPQRNMFFGLIAEYVFRFNCKYQDKWYAKCETARRSLPSAGRHAAERIGIINSWKFRRSVAFVLRSLS